MTQSLNTMHLRTMTLADIPAGMRLKNLAGWNQTPADWERFLRASPDGCFVAEVEGQVVGTATTITYEGRFAWVGMVLVDPNSRGRGIGTHLLGKTIEHLDERRVPTIKLDATPQGRSIYEKLGFVAEYEIERWALRRLSGAPTTRQQTTGPEPNATSGLILRHLLEMDRQVFGADRSNLLRSLHRDASAFTLAVQGPSDEVTGYALGRQGSRADHLGPWVARDEREARRLLFEFLRRSDREAIFVDLAKSNPYAGALLRSEGFEFSRPLTRMFRGNNAHPGRPELLCGMLGPEFG